MNITKRLFLALLLGAAIVLSGTGAAALAADIGLAWDANTDTSLCLDGSRPEDCIAGYNIYYSTVGDGPYTWLGESLDIDNTEWWWDSVQEGTDFYFVVTAFDSGNPEAHESDYSNEVCAYVEPGKTYAMTCGTPYPPLPTVDIIADPTAVLLGESFTLMWSSTDADSATMYDGASTVAVAVNGSTSKTQAATTTYTITVENGEGTASASVTVTSVFPPTVDITAAPGTIESGEISTLTWSSTNATSVTIDNGIGDVALSGSVIVSPAETTTYTITATGPDGVTTGSVTVIVTYPQPSVNISAGPMIITEGETAALVWDSIDATFCAIDNGIGPVNLSDSTTVSPIATTTYTITAAGLGGTATASVTITVIPLPLPTVSISAAPETIVAGEESSTLMWSSTDADSASIDNGIGTVAANGSMEVSPANDTTYTIIVTGLGGTATASVTITVVSPPINPPGNLALIDASPGTITEGESSTLTWNLPDGATSVSIDNGIGDVLSKGYIEVSPIETTTYTITATGPDGEEITTSVTVNVTDPNQGSGGSTGCFLDTLFNSMP